MRRGVTIAILCLAFSALCEAQRGGFGRAGARSAFSGMSRGGSVRGGGFHSGAIRGGSVFRGGGFYRGGYYGGGGYSRGGSFRGGGFYHGGYGYGFGGRGYRGYGHRYGRRDIWTGFGFGFGWGYSPWLWGWGPPLYVSGFYDWGYPYCYDCYGYSPYAGYGYAPAPSYPPVVIVNEERPAPAYAERRDRDTSAERDETPPQPARAYREPDYSIALRDHRIVHAIAYWVLDGKLHYVTKDNEMREIPLSEVDRLFSEQINRDKGVDFRLPGKSPLSAPPAIQQ
jgi:hypothetical protein